MKYMIASDLHGSAYFTQKTVNRFEIEKADKLILLGDIYNHGPRNPLPKDYDPKKVAQILNGIKDKIIVIKGNCDSEVDTMISEFDFFPHLVLESANKLVFLTHGHVYNKDALPKTDFDALIYGHFHTGFIQKGKVTFANAGSVSLPKNDTLNSYLILENDRLILKDLDGNIITDENI
jgi:putative phosphoesterase